MDRPAPFGRPGCVTRAAVQSIEDDALKAEAILLAIEAGMKPDEIEAALGLEADDVFRLGQAKYEPFRRQGETI